MNQAVEFSMVMLSPASFIASQAPTVVLIVEIIHNSTETILLNLRLGAPDSTDRSI